MTTVLHEAWRAAGSPAELAARTGRCARCGAHGRLSAKPAVSKTFSAYDDWARPGSGDTCPMCAWGFTTPGLRQHPHLVATGSLVCLTRQQLSTHLSTSVPPDQALVIPVRAGRKHVMPAAQWGQVTTDTGPLRWAGNEAIRLTTILQLRQLGATASSLSAPVPPFTLLRNRNPHDTARILQLWQELLPWRPDSPWLRLAIYAAQHAAPCERTP